jgi:hypothetical protein
MARATKDGEMGTRLPMTPLPGDVNRRFRFFHREKKRYMSLAALTVEALIHYLDEQHAREPADDERLPV